MITEPVGQVLVNVFYKPVAGNNNIEQEQRNKRDGDGEDTPLKEEIIQVEVIRKAVQCISQFSAAKDLRQLFRGLPPDLPDTPLLPGHP